MTALPDMQLVMDEVLARVDGAEYHWTLIGTNTGPVGAGHRVRIRGFEVWKIGTTTAPVEGSGSCPAWITLVSNFIVSRLPGCAAS